jgi:hypothetical protein
MEGLVVRDVGVCAVLYGGEKPNSTELPPYVCGEMNESISEWSGLRGVTALIWCYRVISRTTDSCTTVLPLYLTCKSFGRTVFIGTAYLLKCG